MKRVFFLKLGYFLTYAIDPVCFFKKNFLHLGCNHLEYISQKLNSAYDAKPSAHYFYVKTLI